jgi:hypothetical protein
MLESLGIDHRGIAEILGGVGFAALAFARHMPPPRADQVWLGAIFDTIQDLTKNNDRIGLRRNELLQILQQLPVSSGPQSQSYATLPYGITPPVIVTNAQEGKTK